MHFEPINNQTFDAFLRRRTASLVLFTSASPNQDLIVPELSKVAQHVRFREFGFAFVDARLESNKGLCLRERVRQTPVVKFYFQDGSTINDDWTGRAMILRESITERLSEQFLMMIKAFEAPLTSVD